MEDAAAMIASRREWVSPREIAECKSMRSLELAYVDSDDDE